MAAHPGWGPNRLATSHHQTAQRRHRALRTPGSRVGRYGYLLCPEPGLDSCDVRPSQPRAVWQLAVGIKHRRYVYFSGRKLKESEGIILMIVSDQRSHPGFPRPILLCCPAPDHDLPRFDSVLLLGLLLGHRVWQPDRIPARQCCQRCPWILGTVVLPFWRIRKWQDQSPDRRRQADQRFPIPKHGGRSPQGQVNRPLLSSVQDCCCRSECAVPKESGANRRCWTGDPPAVHVIPRGSIICADKHIASTKLALKRCTDHIM